MPRRFAGALTERLGLKMTALCFALVLWAVVRARETTEVLVPIRFAPLLDSTHVVAGVLPTLHAVVAGRASDLATLYATPPVIRRVVREDVGDSAQVELAPADVDLEGVPGRVIDVRPRSVTLRIRRAP